MELIGKSAAVETNARPGSTVPGKTDPGNAKPQLGTAAALGGAAELGLGVPRVPPGYKQTEVGVIPEEFCRQVISFPATRKRLEQAMNGSALQEIPIASLRTFKIPAPKSVSEQRAIAETLSDADALLDALDRLIAKKRDLKQAAMQQLLTGRTRLI